MSEPFTILAYHKPDNALRPGLRYSLSTIIAAFNAAAAVLSCQWIVRAAQAHNSSFSGCATGRLHADDLFLLGFLPACTVVLTKIASEFAPPKMLFGLRLGMLASLAAYGVLWLDILGMLEILKFNILRMH